MTAKPLTNQRINAETSNAGVNGVERLRFMSGWASKFATAAVSLGILLVIVSFFLTSLVGGRRAWTDDQAKSFTEAAGELHRLTYEAAEAHDRAQQAATAGVKSPMSQTRLSPEANAPSDPAETPERNAQRAAAKLATARDRFSQQRAALEDARSYGQGAAAVMRWLGFGLLAVGILGLIIRKSDDGK